MGSAGKPEGCEVVTRLETTGLGDSVLERVSGSVGTARDKGFPRNVLDSVGEQVLRKNPSVLTPTLHPLGVALSVIWDNLHSNHSIS